MRFRVAAVCGALAFPSVARAAELGPDGSLILDAGAAVVVDFETEVDAMGAPLGAVSEGENGALHGALVLPLQPFQGVDVPVALPKERASYRVSAWLRGGEVTADLELSYSPELDRVDELAVLYPTGRVTSDGWIEVANDHVRIEGPTLHRATVGFFAPAGAEIDAVEIVRDVDQAELAPVPHAACAGATDAVSCAPFQRCEWSTCRDVSGLVPPIPSDRDDVAEYLANRARLLFGPFRERDLDLPTAELAFGSMGWALSKYDYWNGFALGVRRLHDGHTTTSNVASFVLRNPRRLALCFLEGDADLSHGVAPSDPAYLDVLVSHVGGDHNLGLKAGDRLVSVDGQHPIAWARSLVRDNWGFQPTSNRETFAELAESLRGLVSRYAATLEVVRCDPATLTCDPPELVDVGALPLEPEGTPVDSVSCDNRPLRHLADSPADHSGGVFSGVVLESDADEGIYGLEWESLYTTGSDGIAGPVGAAVTEWKQSASGVILDHRSGNGGTTLGADLLWNFAVKRHALDFYEDRVRAEEPSPSQADAASRWQLALSNGYVNYAGVNQPKTGVPVALLVTRDVSASDWLPLGMKGQPGHRIFGPFQTNGAFSTRYAFGYWLGVSYVMAVGDTTVDTGLTLNGKGVEPDEIVLPKQSDLLVGKDTVYEAALAWVRQEMQP